MYRKLKTGVTNPSAIASFLLYRAVDINRYVNYWRQGERYYVDGVDIFQEDWDNLIVLDACRFDDFRLCCDLDGELQRRTARGSMSEEFIRGNFTGVQAMDTVYVSANLWYAKLQDEIGADIYRFVPVERDAFDGETSHPETVTQIAKAENEQHPNKRLIVHYLQPHQPYFDEEGELFRLLANFPRELKKGDGPDDQKTVIDAYRSTLRVALSSVKDLLNDLTGRTVITADHGELLGERSGPLPIRQYGHPRGAFVDPLLKVPWFVIDSDDRKDIVGGKVSDSISVDDTTVDDQLEALGYKL